ncbi:MAG TPA: macro domain-containing protein [Candidatus Limnocylindrales bacterium]|jgi:O-acetyl-ADP-ribose deacetylase (regulator of RNase III)
MPRLRIARGSIVDLEVDAIVNAANSSLQGGGGVDGAIHRAAGPRLAESAIRQAPCPPGEARITNGFDLKAKYVIHTVGPVYDGGGGSAEATLASCYRSSLGLAEERKLGSVAIPAISTGRFGYPSALAAAIAVRETAAWLDEHPHPRFVVLSAFSEESAVALEQALEDLARPDLTED